MQYVFMIRSHAGGKKYVTQLRLVTYFLPPARERIKNTYCINQRLFLYLSRSRTKVEPSHCLLRWMAQMTCFRPRKCLLGVKTMGDVIWGKYSPITPQKGAWIGSFKPKCQNLYIAISPELLIRRSSDLTSEFRPQKTFSGWSAITPKQIQHGWWPPSWKSIWGGCSDLEKFNSRMQNDTPITRKWSRSKPEVEFQYGGCLYFETGSSYISAVKWDISTKFGLLIDFDLLKAVTSTNTKLELVFSRRGSPQIYIL